MLSLSFNPLFHLCSLRRICQCGHHVAAGLNDIIDAGRIEALQKSEYLLPVLDTLPRIGIGYASTLAGVRGENGRTSDAVVNERQLICEIVCICNPAVQSQSAGWWE